MNLNELISKIEQWAEDRNIIKGSKPIDQAMKLFSEFGELADAVAKNDIHEIKDGVGDCFVVLTIMAKQCGLNIQNSIEYNHEFRSDNRKHTIVDLGLELNYFSRSLNDFTLGNSIKHLTRISFDSNLDFKECVKTAYDDIKNRKGILWNGVFVKSTDESYPEVLNMYQKSMEGNYSA